MIRKDVMHFAEPLDVISGLGVMFIYDWIFNVCIEKQMKPHKLKFGAVPGKVFLADEPDRYYMERFDPLGDKVA